MEANPFFDTYQSFSNIELYEILKSEAEYQPAAVAAATALLKNRQLSDKDMNELEKHWAEQSNNKEIANQKKKAFENKIKNYGNKVATDLNPMTPYSTARSIRVICIGTALLIIYSFIKEFELLKWAIQDLSNFDPVLYFGIIFPYIILPVGIWKFWHRKKWGWRIIAGWTSFTIVGILFSIWQVYKYGGSFRFSETSYSQPDFSTYILSLLIFSGFVVFLNRPTVTELFGIKKDSRFYTILIATFLAIIFFVGSGGL